MTPPLHHHYTTTTTPPPPSHPHQERERKGRKDIRGGKRAKKNELVSSDTLVQGTVDYAASFSLLASLPGSHINTVKIPFDSSRNSLLGGSLPPPRRTSMFYKPTTTWSWSFLLLAIVQSCAVLGLEGYASSLPSTFTSLTQGWWWWGCGLASQDCI